MLNINIPNARLLDENNDTYSDLSGRDAYCHKTMGYGRLTKEYRDCKKGLRQDDKGVKEDRKNNPDYIPSSNNGMVTSDNLGADRTPTGEPNGQSSTTLKNNDSGKRIMGMEQAVAIPVIAVSLLAISIGGFFLFKKLAK